MDWDDIRHFLAVAREGQILGAARRLGVSQAKLSRRIAALEAALGQRLFDRTTRGSVLTEQGRALFATAERVESDLLTMASELAGPEGIAGTVRIGTPDGFGAAFLAPRLGALRALHPGLRVQLVPVSRSFSLSEREADLAIMVGRPDKGRLRVRRLTAYTLGVYAARDYLARHGKPADTAALRAHDLVGYVDDLMHTPELAYTAEVLRDWRASVEIATAVGQVAAVRGGAGIGVLHDFMAAADPDLELLFPEIRIERSYWTVWHENLRAARPVRAVVDFLDAAARAERVLFVRPGTKTGPERGP
jgi:DNA-binding transcriptional LysR family regulator